MIRALFLAVSLLFNVFLVRGQHIPHELDSIFESLNEDGELSGAFIVVDSGEVIFEKYIGFEDAAKQNRITPESRFELASVSKPFTAMAIMQLVEKGKLSLEDDIQMYFPKLKFAHVRIQNLLQHTSGIPEFLGFDAQWINQNKINNNADILALLETKIDSTLFPPGDAFAYSNTNYLLLASIVEKVSGQSFADYLQEHIFKPAGMEHTSVFSARSPGADLSHYAKGFAYDAKSNGFIPVDEVASYRYTTYFDGVYGPYGISSTAQDLLKWSRAIQDNKLLKPESFRRALHSDTLNNGKPIDMRGLLYGFGWLFTDSTDAPNKMHFHTGGYPGYQNIIVRDLEHKRYFIALMNKQNTVNVFPLASAVDAAIRGKAIPTVTRDKLDVLSEVTTLMEFQIQALLGTYSYTEMPDLKFQITADENGNLFAQLTGQPSIEVFPKSELELFYTVVKATITFTKENDTVTSLTLHQNGQELTFNKEK